LDLELAVEVSRVQREAVASAEYEIILMPGFACLGSPAFDRQPMCRKGVYAELWQGQHRFRGDRFGWPQH
jgi:hypothetical protein